MYELVDKDTREGEGYRSSPTECCRFALSAGYSPGTTYEIWQVADDETRTRMCLVAEIAIPMHAEVVL